MIANDLKKEKPTDGEMEVSHHTKLPCLRAVDLGRKSVGRSGSANRSLASSFGQLNTDVIQSIKSSLIG